MARRDAGGTHYRLARDGSRWLRAAGAAGREEDVPRGQHAVPAQGDDRLAIAFFVRVDDGVNLFAIAGLHEHEVRRIAVDEALKTLVLARPPVAVLAASNDYNEINLILEDAVQQKFGIGRRGKPHDFSIG